MIIDTSAVLAILFAEEDAERHARAPSWADVRLMSAVKHLEAGIIVDKQIGAAAGRQLDALIARAEVHIEPVTRSRGDRASSVS
jgi:ribonuclease VapC